MMAFVSNPRRDASPTIAGFVFQVNLTILRWIELGNDEHLELERGEDIDTVKENGAGLSAQGRLLEQIKARSTRSLTLRSEEALGALANFCHHRATNPNWNLKFRFVTTAGSGMEQGWNRADSGIETWGAIQRGQYNDEDRTKALAALRGFLRSCARPEKTSPDAWHALEEVLAPADDTQLGQIVLAFEWGVGSGDYAQIETQILATLARGIASGEAVETYEHLFAFVFRLLCLPGQKLLTKNRLQTELQTPSVTKADRAIVELVRGELQQMAVRVGTMETAMIRQAKEVTSLKQTVERIGKSLGFDAAFALTAIPLSTEVPDMVIPCAPRDTLIEQLLMRAQANGVVAIVAEPGSGKTQALLLAARKVQRKVHWLNLPRQATEAQACILLDALVQLVGGQPGDLPFQQRYDGGAERFRVTLVVIEDLPRVSPGGPLARRIERLARNLRGVDALLLFSSYYPLPATIEQSLGRVQSDVPRFAIADVGQLLAAAEAPEHLRQENICQLLVAVTEGLPTLVMAAVRYLAGRSWNFTTKEIEGLFVGEFASSHRHDARSLLQLTVPDPDERELLVRMSLAIGTFTKEDVAAVARVPKSIRLPGEKVDRATGVWLQQIGNGRYLRSPLITPMLADSLDSVTRNGVHFALALRILQRKTLAVLEAFACVNHLMMAGEVTFAITVVIQTLATFLELDELVEDDLGFTHMWPTREGLERVDLNLQINLRAMQIAVRAKQGKDVAPMIEVLDTLIAEAHGEGWGVAAATSGLAIHLVWQDPILSNQFLLQALNSYKDARLPDGSPLPHAEAPLEDILWISANNCRSDVHVDSWLATVSRLSREQFKTLKHSNLKEDNVTILCDGIWMRVYQKPESERSWQPVKKKLEEVDATARIIDFPLLEAAALRTLLMVLAEWEGKLDDAVALAESSLAHFTGDDCRFLIMEVTGRQLSYAGKRKEAMLWLERALHCDAYDHSLLRRNALITMAELQGAHDSSKAAKFTAEAVRISKDGKLVEQLFIETLVEHAMALWKAGESRQSFETLEEAAIRLLAIQSNTNKWKALFARVFVVAAYFSALALNGKPPDGQPEPQQGLFLSANEQAHSGYRVEQLAYIAIRLAMFADGVNDVDKAASWTWRAIDSAKQIPAAWDGVRMASWHAMPAALLSDDFAQAAQLVDVMIAPDATDIVAKAKASMRTNAAQGVSGVGTLADSAPSAPTSLLRITPIVPIALRLAFLQFCGATVASIAAYLAEIESVIPPHLQPEDFISEMRRALVDETDWQTLWTDGCRAFDAHEYVRACVLCIGAVSKASTSQSLYLQVSVAQNLEGFFKSLPSLYREIVAPFFAAYWERTIFESIGLFHTAQAYTRRQLQVADGTPEGTRRLLAAMRFCLGLKFPAEAMKWLDSN